MSFMHAYRSISFMRAYRSIRSMSFRWLSNLFCNKLGSLGRFCSRLVERYYQCVRGVDQQLVVRLSCYSHLLYLCHLHTQTYTHKHGRGKWMGAADAGKRARARTSTSKTNFNHHNHILANPRAPRKSAASDRKGRVGGVGNLEHPPCDCIIMIRDDGW